MADRPLIGSHGGFRNLHAFKLAEVVYDATIIFCERFVDPKSRTTDQMVQAARSGRQNIAEGSVDSATSKKSELFLTNIARGSLVELQLDYEDYLRQRGLTIWNKDDARCKKIREVAFCQETTHRSDSAHPSNPSNPSDLSHQSIPAPPRRYRQDIAYPLYAKFFERTNAEIAANSSICLINQATYLLNRLLMRLERDFLTEGGFTEKLYNKRSQAKRSHKPAN